MTYYLCSGDTFSVITEGAVDIRKELPAKTFMVKLGKSGFYLEMVPGFDRLDRYYGDIEKNAQRILNTFSQRNSSMGVMMSGEKGSGKTLLSKLVSIECQLLGMPTIVVSTGFINNNNDAAMATIGDVFNKFIQDIDQECVIIFDEFEKMYPDQDSQVKMLTLLDGTFSTKKLFVLTCNDKWKVNSHMRNRPGRLHYLFEYTGLEEDFIREYCEENLNNKDHIETVVRVSTLFSAFNFDMLQAFINEMNMYDETALEILPYINCRPDNESNNHSVTYSIESIRINGKDVDLVNIYPRTIHGSILSKTEILFDYNDDSVRFSRDDLVNMNGAEGIFEFKNDIGYLKIKQNKTMMFDYAKMLL